MRYSILSDSLGRSYRQSKFSNFISNKNGMHENGLGRMILHAKALSKNGAHFAQLIELFCAGNKIFLYVFYCVRLVENLNICQQSSDRGQFSGEHSYRNNTTKPEMIKRKNRICKRRTLYICAHLKQWPDNGSLKQSILLYSFLGCTQFSAVIVWLFSRPK